MDKNTLLFIAILGFLTLFATLDMGVEAQVTSSFSEVDASACRAAVLGSFSKLHDYEEKMHAIAALKRLGGVDDIGSDKKEQLCKWAVDLLQNEEEELSNVHSAAQINKLLSCKVTKLPQLVLNTLESSETIEELYYALNTAVLMKSDEYQVHLASIPERLKQLFVDFDGMFNSDIDSEAVDSYSTGLALNIVGSDALKGVDSAQSVIDSVKERIDEMIGHADAGQGEDWLSFEGRNGKRMEATSLIIQGLLKMKLSAEAAADKLSRLTEYVVTHKQCETPSEAYYMLRALDELTKPENKEIAPYALMLDTPVLSLSESESDSAVVRVSVADVLGKPEEGKVTLVRAGSSTRDDEEAVVSNVEMEKAISGYSYDLKKGKSKIEPGYYTLEFSIGDDEKVKAKGTERILKITSKYTVSDFGIGVMEHGEGKMATLDSPPMTLTDSIVFDAKKSQSQNHKLKLQFNLSTKHCHQTMFKLNDIYIQAHLTDTDTYTYAATVSHSDFGRNGKYAIAVVVGDMFMENPVVWNVGHVIVSGIDAATATEGLGESSMFDILPEIQHIFKTPDSRPPKIVSSVFTLIVLSPLVVLVIGFFFLKLNFSLLTVSSISIVHAIGFICSLISGAVLMAMFWLYLDMFTTLKYLAIVVVCGAFFGVRTLSDLATLRAAQGAGKDKKE